MSASGDSGPPGVESISNAFDYFNMTKIELAQVKSCTKQTLHFYCFQNISFCRKITSEYDLLNLLTRNKISHGKTMAVIQQWPYLVCLLSSFKQLRISKEKHSSLQKWQKHSFSLQLNLKPLSHSRYNPVLWFRGVLHFLPPLQVISSFSFYN